MPGNDDLGTMAAAVVWWMLGLYPELPGVGGVAIASPSFPGITVHLGNGKTLQINATGLPGYYVQSAKLNGKDTSDLWLPVSTILAGATLDFTLGTTTSTWGQGATMPSFGIGTFASMGDALNNRGIASDSSPTDGNFDGYGWSYSAEAIAAASVGGGTVTSNGVQFQWSTTGGVDNIIPIGQTITFATQQKGGRLAFLGSASDGPSSGTGTINYSDGTSAPLTLNFGDWTLGGGKAGLTDTNQIAIQTQYRNNMYGQTDPTKTYIFFDAKALDANKTIASITLPASVSRGRIHLFSIAVAP
jgi:hypothetical protein